MAIKFATKYDIDTSVPLTCDAVKRWLFSVRELTRLRRVYLNEIDLLSEECEGIRQGSASVLGLAHIKKTSVSDPTLENVVRIIDKFASRINALALEIDRIDLHVADTRARFERLFCETDMTVSEYEVLFWFYFEGMSNVEVGLASFYCEDMVYKLKASGIAKIVEGCSARSDERGRLSPDGEGVSH